MPWLLTAGPPPHLGARMILDTAKFVLKTVAAVSIGVVTAVIVFYLGLTVVDVAFDLNVRSVFEGDISAILEDVEFECVDLGNVTRCRQVP